MMPKFTSTCCANMELAIPLARASFHLHHVPSSSMVRKRSAGSLSARHSHSYVAFSSSPSSSAAAAAASIARDHLLRLISDQQRGLATQKNPKKRAEIIQAMEALAALGTGMITTDQSLSATWRMLWTTEKEQLFIIEKAHLFGTEAGDILQIIDVEGRKLNNVITFPPDGVFLVNSTIEVVSSQRVNFRFTSASLRGSGWSVPVPPFGQGWFDSVYMDEMIRIAKDIRGDYLVVDRAPYTWKG